MPKFRGGKMSRYRRRGTGIELVKDLIDGMHAKFHTHSGGLATDSIPALHVYNWITVIEKRTHGLMGHFKIGGSDSEEKR
jgi:hypothetical protein